MKQKFKTILIPIILISIFGIGLSNISYNTHATNSRSLKLNSHNTTISVTSGTGFPDAGFIGSGTINDPYIIENLDIEGHGSENLIEINDTTDYFVIKDMTLHGGANGIVLKNADNAYIIGNTIYENERNGIKFEDSSNTVVEDNEIYNNGGEICPHQGLSLNQLRLNGHSGGGLHYDPSDSSVITDNHIHDNSIAGIIIQSATNITIQSNTIEDNGNCLLNFENGLGLNQEGVNNGHGITIFVGDATINNNLIQNNDDYGILLDTLSVGSTVENNNFIENNGTALGQARDDGSGNSFNCNYWGESITGTYYINGSRGNTDTCESGTAFTTTTGYYDFIPTTTQAEEDDSSLLMNSIFFGLICIILIRRKKYS